MISRAEALKALAGQKFDVVVIGGGVTGAGVALDAASRGYSVALVERDDWAAGTSSRSSKMVHGGLRYLEQLDLGLVREALLERALMVRLAPHLVYPTPFLIPTFERRPSRRFGVGLNMYDAMASTPLARRRRERRAERELGIAEEEWAPDRHRQVSGEEVVAMVPALAPRKPHSAYLFYDCQTDDVRLVLTILGEAERFGTVMLNGAEVVEVCSGDDGRATGVACVEAESGERFEVFGANVVNATGVWADRLLAGSPDSEGELPVIRPSRGAHITLASDDLPLEWTACIVPAGKRRSILALPWYGRTLIGTTDEDYEGELEHVPPSGADVDYLLDAVNAFFGTSLTRDHATGAYAGVRPLISTKDPRRSVDISRRAELYETASGLLTITGGKLTTWRRMAKQVVDRMVEREGRVAPCRTEDIPLGMPVQPGGLEPVEGVGADSLLQLAFRYGYAAREVLQLAAERPELRAPIVEGRPDLLAEVAIAARLEQARKVGDVLLRRTRLGLLAAPQLRTADSVLPVAEVLGVELGWDPQRVRAEAQAWVELARAEGIDIAALDD